MWNDVGVTPDFVTIGPLAVYNALAWDQQFDESTPGTVILDVGTTSTDLIVCEPGRLWIRTFPVGGHQFTQALVDAFKLSYAKADALKLQAEQSKHFRHILQAMRPVFSDLAQDVQRSIGYYQSSHKDANLTRLIGLGSTFNLPGLRKYLGQQLQMEGGATHSRNFHAPCYAESRRHSGSCGDPTRQAEDGRERGHLRHRADGAGAQYTPEDGCGPQHHRAG